MRLCICPMNGFSWFLTPHGYWRLLDSGPPIVRNSWSPHINRHFCTPGFFSSSFNKRANSMYTYSSQGESPSYPPSDKRGRIARTKTSPFSQTFTFNVWLWYFGPRKKEDGRKNDTQLKHHVVNPFGFSHQVLTLWLSSVYFSSIPFTPASTNLLDSNCGQPLALM